MWRQAVAKKLKGFATQKFGVGLILMNKLNPDEIWIIEEQIAKPWLGKRKHDWSIPMETTEAGESSNQCFSRLLVEELGEEIMVTSPKLLIPQVIIKKVGFLRLFTAKATITDLPQPLDPEVLPVGWKPWEDLLNLPNLRLGMEQILRYYFLGQRQGGQGDIIFVD